MFCLHQEDCGLPQSCVRRAKFDWYIHLGLESLVWNTVNLIPQFLTLETNTKTLLVVDDLILLLGGSYVLQNARINDPTSSVLALQSVLCFYRLFDTISLPSVFYCCLEPQTTN